MNNSIVLYTGPSMLDGSPIVVIATVGSKNEKTGALVQTWILRADMSPVEASKLGADSSVCGDCPRRQSTGGDCYVIIHNAPRSVWAKWDRLGRQDGDLLASCIALESDAKGYGLRLGSYGDPMAVPFQVWRMLIDSLTPNMVLGYTHQHKTFQGTAHGDWFRDNVMASCDTVEEAADARSRGWRFFLATPNGEGKLDKTVECLADRDGSTKTCLDCGMCNGAKIGAMKASIYIAAHGARSVARAKRLPSLAVLR